MSESWILYLTPSAWTAAVWLGGLVTGYFVSHRCLSDRLVVLCEGPVVQSRAEDKTVPAGAWRVSAVRADDPDRPAVISALTTPVFRFVGEPPIVQAEVVASASDGCTHGEETGLAIGDVAESKPIRCGAGYVYQIPSVILCDQPSSQRRVTVKVSAGGREKLGAYKGSLAESWLQGVASVLESAAPKRAARVRSARKEE